MERLCLDWKGPDEGDSGPRTGRGPGAQTVSLVSFPPEARRAPAQGEVGSALDQTPPAVRRLKQTCASDLLWAPAWTGPAGKRGLSGPGGKQPPFQICSPGQVHPVPSEPAWTQAGGLRDSRHREPRPFSEGPTAGLAGCGRLGGASSGSRPLNHRANCQKGGVEKDSEGQCELPGDTAAMDA